MFFLQITRKKEDCFNYTDKVVFEEWQMINAE